MRSRTHTFIQGNRTLNNRISILGNQSVFSVSLLLLAICLAWGIGLKIVSQDLTAIAYVFLCFVAIGFTATVLRNWRLGFYFFLVWLLFEDLVRKYFGNDMAIYFAKDFFLALVYIAFYLSIRRGETRIFRPPFLVFGSLLLWLGVAQIFNPNSPHILYGFLGFKVYFYYVPLIFVGYALIRGDEDLRKFLVLNGFLAAIIGGIGIVQAIVGNSFLNPTHLAPELRDLGNLQKITPLSNQIFTLPDSVFVSSGRFSLYLTFALILTVGTTGYLLLYTKRSRKLIYVVFAIVVTATLLSGSRSATVSAVTSALVLSVGFLWGAPWRWRHAHRLTKAIRRTFIFGSLGLACLLLIFPEEAGSRIAFYTETLSPSSSAYQGSYRTWDYPIKNLELALTNPNWVLGNGIGTASLGNQYVAKAIGGRPLNISVEEGFGTMIVEMGILAPLLWVLCSVALLVSCWRVVRSLRQTRFFPIGFAIFWYAFLLLLPLTFGSLNSYQNYINNAYMWLMVGVLFRLGTLQTNQSVPERPGHYH